MAVFAISDLHLPGGDLKPMDVFGEHWRGHFVRIREDWLSRVTDDDIVLLPGDLSWAMTLDMAVPDLEAIGHLPGQKVILRGNHDYWWGAIGRVRRSLPAGMYAVQNDCVRLGDVVVCGTRGWTLPDDDTEPGDLRIFNREIIRLDMTLSSGRAAAGDDRLICMMHYPPLMKGRTDTPFTEVIDRYAPGDVVYGHLHGQALAGAFRGERAGIRYHQVSCDGLGFRLYRLPD